MADAPIDTVTTDAGDRPALPVRIVVTDDLERSRSTVFFRLILAIPHLIVVALWGIAAALVSIILWIALVFEGRAPRVAAALRRQLRPLRRAGERLPPHRGRTMAAVRRQRRVPDRRRARRRAAAVAADVLPGSSSRSPRSCSQRRSEAGRGSATRRGRAPTTPRPPGRSERAPAASPPRPHFSRGSRRSPRDARRAASATSPRTGSRTRRR